MSGARAEPEELSKSLEPMLSSRAGEARLRELAGRQKRPGLLGVRISGPCRGSSPKASASPAPRAPSIQAWVSPASSIYPRTSEAPDAGAKSLDEGDKGGLESKPSGAPAADWALEEMQRGA